MMSVRYEKARKKFLKEVNCCMCESPADSQSFLGKLEDLFTEEEKD